jgi:2-dehydro-3-deoxygalactonokinase
MSGMVGSAQGWHAVPYLGLGVPLTALGQHLFRVPDGPADRTCAIVPGYVIHAADGSLDVMRGEETQLLGALALAAQAGRDSDGWYVLPGTHSKWVRLRGGCIERFSTFMTGELYALLSKHGTLAPLMSPAVAVAPASLDESRAAFDTGLRAAAHGSLSNTLFGCRARVVAGVMPAAQAGDYVSGLLIGAEWHDALAREQAAGGHISRVVVIGAPALAERHRQAGATLGIEVTLIDPRAAYLAALVLLGASAIA